MDPANTPDELLDIVNEKDEVIGTLPKKQVHADAKLIHREVRIYLFDENNRLLLQRRSKYKKVNPLLWCESCAGHVTAGDTYEITAHRELQEELGIDTNLELLDIAMIKSGIENRFTAIYRGSISSTSTFTLQEAEVDQVAFMTRDEVEQLIRSGEKLGKFFVETLDDIWKSKLSLAGTQTSD